MDFDEWEKALEKTGESIGFSGIRPYQEIDRFENISLEEYYAASTVLTFLKYSETAGAEKEVETAVRGVEKFRDRGLIGEKVGEFAGDMENSPVFLGCAERDPYIPKKRVDETEEVFQGLNAEVEKYIFEGSQHGITDHEIEKASELIETL
ncbi:MAG: alpha/beta hydrolase [Candidatus Nanohaloarchaea archaeon]